MQIVIFTNQAGIQIKKQRPEDITGKIWDIQQELGVPLYALVATGFDHWSVRVRVRVCDSAFLPSARVVYILTLASMRMTVLFVL